MQLHSSENKDIIEDKVGTDITKGILVYVVIGDNPELFIEIIEQHFY